MINPVFHLGFVTIHWYGLILATAILVGYFLARKNCWKFGISKKDVDDFSFWLVLVGILGARIYYIVFNYSYYFQNLEEIYKIWNGGLSIYGAIITGVLFSYLYSKRKAYTFLQFFDLLALSLPLAQAIGRFGNYVNQEAYGTVTDLPWKIYIAADNKYHHPAFLYEAIWDMVVFLILLAFLKRINKSGTIGWIYLGAYSFGRFFIEGIRVDSFFISGFRVDQVVALLIVLISGFALIKSQKTGILG